MIYIFNFSIAIISIISIFITYFYPQLIFNNHFKNHTVIFLLKLFFISMFIYFFIFNLSISNYKIFIISGYINFTIFHLIEGFVNQKNLFNNENNN